MKLLTIKIVVNKDGYVKNTDEYDAIQEDASRICNNFIGQMIQELESAGYKYQVKIGID